MTNKEIVLRFYEDVFNAWDESRIPQYVREDYRQHNPTVENGREGFIAFCRRFFPLHPHMEIKQIVEEGDTVMVFFKCTVDSGVNKVCDIYRLQDGMLAEHWDVVEHNLDMTRETANGNGYF